MYTGRDVERTSRGRVTFLFLIATMMFFLFNLITFYLVAGMTVRISSHSVTVFLSISFCYFSLQTVLFFSGNLCALPPISPFNLFFLFSGAVLGRRCTSGWYSNSSPGNRCVVLYSSVRMNPHLSLGTYLILHCFFWLYWLHCSTGMGQQIFVFTMHLSLLNWWV